MLGSSLTGPQRVGDRSKCFRGCWTSESCQIIGLLCWGWWKRDPAPAHIWIYAQQECSGSFIKSVSGTSSMGQKNENSTGCCSWLSLPPWRDGVSGTLWYFFIALILLHKIDTCLFYQGIGTIRWKTPNEKQNWNYNISIQIIIQNNPLLSKAAVAIGCWNWSVFLFCYMPKLRVLLDRSPRLASGEEGQYS